jgi:hypothetical protein
MEDNSPEKLAADLHEALADKQHPNLEKAMQLALSDERALREILSGIVSKHDAYRYNCLKVLLQISETQPLVLYPEWDYFVELLQSDNSFSQYPAVHIIATLVEADEDDRFDAIFDTFYSLLDDESVMIAGHVAGVSGKIAKAKPKLQTRVTKRLLDIDATHFEPGRKDLIKSYAIESFDAYFEEAENKEEIVEFVRRQLDCTSPKTRKSAKSFLRKWGKAE